MLASSDLFQTIVSNHSENHVSKICKYHENKNDSKFNFVDQPMPNPSINAFLVTNRILFKKFSQYLSNFTNTQHTVESISDFLIAAIKRLLIKDIKGLVIMISSFIV